MQCQLAARFVTDTRRPEPTTKRFLLVVTLHHPVTWGLTVNERLVIKFNGEIKRPLWEMIDWANWDFDESNWALPCKASFCLILSPLY